MTTPETIRKQSAEKYPILVDFTNKLPTGATISSATSAAYDLVDNSDVSATLINGTTKTDTSVTVKLQAGITNHKYKITVTATLSDSFSVLEEDFYLEIIDQ